jgi:glycosyltransferase involved in cell wall biosynthesis
MNTPLITIITVVYNGVFTLEETILSVINQTYKNIEYIIIDGGSSDGTIDIIKKYEDKITYWISEPDNGIYDAMNKGIDKASGEYLLFIGADDCFITDNIIEKIFNGIPNLPDFIYTNVLYSTGYEFHSRYSFDTLLHNTIHHQGAFYRKTLFADFRYDTNLKLVSDYELNLYIYLNRVRFKLCKLNICMIKCNEGGVSRKYKILAYKETNIVRNKYINGYKYSFIRFLYYIKFKYSMLKFKILNNNVV